MRKVVALMLSVGALLALAGPASAGSAPSGTVVDVAVGASGGGAFDKNPRDYDVLVQAVLAADLDGVLADPSATFTVFAPNDRAFKRLAKDLTGKQPRSERAAFNAIAGALASLNNGDPIPVLTQVLLYHVVGGQALDALEVIRSEQLTMANGGTVGVGFLTLADAEPELRDPRFVLPNLNIETSNGIIHTIDRVLIPVDLP